MLPPKREQNISGFICFTGMPEKRSKHQATPGAIFRFSIRHKWQECERPVMFVLPAPDQGKQNFITFYIILIRPIKRKNSIRIHFIISLFNFFLPPYWKQYIPVSVFI